MSTDTTTAGKLSAAATNQREANRDLQDRVIFPTLSGVLLTAAIIGVGLLATTLIGGGAMNKLVTTMLIDAIMVVGIQIYIGNTGIFSFGHVAFGAIAGYTFALLVIDPQSKQMRIPEAPFGLATVQTSVWVGLLAAIAAALLVALVIALGLARSGASSGAVAATVITLALLFVTNEVASSWNKLTGGDRSGLAFGLDQTLDSRVPIYGFLLLAVLVAVWFERSRHGRLAIAAREDDLAARAMGINPAAQQTISLLLSVVIVAIAASLRVYNLGSILPDTFFFDYTLTTLVMLVVGGRNGVTGALTGVAVITFFHELARRLGSSGYELFGLSLDNKPFDYVFREGLPMVVMGLMMVGFMIWRPSGILDDWDLDRFLSRRFGWGRTDELPAPAPTERNEPAATLDTDAVAVTFGGFRALGGATVHADNSEVVGLIGPNGAGKTTLLNVITGLVRATEGTVKINNENITKAPSYKIARSGIVRTFQNLRLFGALTVRENVEAAHLVAQKHRADRGSVDVDTLIATAGLWEHRHRRARNLDYGNSRRLELARAAAMMPTFLLLDEPTSGMSDAESIDMIQHVRDMAGSVGAGVVVIDHDLNFITGICDRIYCLDQGQVIASGTPTEIQANADVRAAYLGTSAE